ncbi:hypothetical protein [Mammaliicoccus sciuri]|uniref:hypothetical protein n=1 Tax=Mammaliicoccus sciuri TaxID=1296 RepID=UPI002DB82D96|nr:hypothetical protein [Mammaliicoccus sciuri]MEB8265325.1 hypothetical protein [Mammaliicoccus sciuri]
MFKYILSNFVVAALISFFYWLSAGGKTTLFVFISLFIILLVRDKMISLYKQKRGH